jgi:hypothetical protein
MNAIRTRREHSWELALGSVKSDAHKPRGRVKWGYLNTARALSNKGKRVTEKEAKKREEEVLKRKRGNRSTKNTQPHGHITIGEDDHGHEDNDSKPKPNVPAKPSDQTRRCPEYFKFPGGIACGPQPTNINPLDDEGNPAPARKVDLEAKKTPEDLAKDKRDAERLLLKELLAEGTALADKIEASGFKSLDSEEKALYQKLKGKMYNNDAFRIDKAMGQFFVYQVKCQSGRFPPSCHRANVQYFDDDQLDKWQDKSGWVVDTTHASPSDIPVEIRTYYKPTSKKVPGYIDWNRHGQPGEPSPGPLGKGIEGPYQHGYGGYYYKEGWPSAVEWEGSDHWLLYNEMDIDVALASLGNTNVDAAMKAEGWVTEVPKVAALIELVEEDEKATHSEDESQKYFCGPYSASTGFVCEENGYSKSENERREAEKTSAANEAPPVDPTTPAAAIPDTHDAEGRATLAYINSLKTDCARVHKDDENACELYEKALATREEEPEPEEEKEEEEEPPPPAAPLINVVSVAETKNCGGATNNRNPYVLVGGDFHKWARSVGQVRAEKWLAEQSHICLTPQEFAEGYKIPEG